MTGPGRAQFPALGTTAVVLTTDPERIGAAATLLRTELQAVDRACSRFRADSEVEQLRAQAGREVRVSPLLAEFLDVALGGARRTGGLVDPTVATAVAALGYDRDFAAVPSDSGAPVHAPGPAPGWHRVLLDPDRALVLLPRGVALDLGATAKAHAADRAAAAIAGRLGTGVLVSLGGDISVAGPPPAGGWQVCVGDDHGTADLHPHATVSLQSGGLATSSTTRRRWRRGGRAVHHIVDPRTGDIAPPCWRTVAAAARTCLDANVAATAAIVLGAAAPDWLATQSLPALLVAIDGSRRTVGDWPADRGRAA